jgi:hypothetical protein
MSDLREKQKCDYATTYSATFSPLLLLPLLLAGFFFDGLRTSTISLVVLL